MPRSSRARRGTAALEFAFTALPLFTLILAVCEVSYDEYTQIALDFALHEAARQVQIGNAQNISTAGQFAQALVCPALANLLSCGKVVVNVHPVTPDFFNSPASILNGTSFCPGAPGELMLAQASYAGPSFVGALLPGFATQGAGGLVHTTLSSAGFVNESFPPGAALPAGCS